MRTFHPEISRGGLRCASVHRLPVRPARLLREAVLATGVGAMVLDESGSVVYCSPAAAEMFGSSRLRIEGQHISSLVPDFPLPGRRLAGGIAYAAGPDLQERWGTFRAFGLDGHAFPLEIRLRKQSPRKCRHLLLTVRPVVRQRGEENSLARLQRIAQGSDDAVMITTTDGDITYVNPAFEAMTGFCCAELLGRNAAILKSGAHAPAFYDSLWSALRDGKEFHRCFVNRKKSGEIFYVEQSIRPFVDPDGAVTHYVATGHDISERVLTGQRLEQQANQDYLTGLTSRALFMDRLRQAFSHAARRKDRFALLYVDLDDLKKVNDRYGHAAGDELLRIAAARLRQSVREGDTVARLGGDEFALILFDAKQRDDVERVVEKILEAFLGGMLWGGERLAIRASIGACLYPENGDDGEQLIRHADAAMYHQKTAGGNGCCFFDAEKIG